MPSDARHRARAVHLAAWALVVLAAVLPDAAHARPAPPAADAPKIDAWTRRAERAAEGGDGAERRYWASLALKHAPDNAELLFFEGRHASFAGQYDRAIWLLEAGVRAAPRYHDIRLHLARVYGWAQQHPLALANAAAVARKQPDSEEAQRTAGDVASWAGAYDDAARYWGLALLHAPRDHALSWRIVDACVQVSDFRCAATYVARIPRSLDDRGQAALRERVLAGDPNVRVDAGVSYTFTSPGDWYGGSAGVLARPVRPVWMGVRVDWQRRSFGGGAAAADTMLTFPVLATLAPRLVLTVEPGAAVEPVFSPRGRVTAELAYDVNGPFGFVAGYRYSEYGAVDAHAVYPSLAFHLWPASIEPTLVVTTGPTGVDLTGRLKVMVHTADRGRVEIWGHVGTEPLEPSVAAQYDAPLQAGILGAVTRRVRPSAELRFTYAFSTPISEIEPNAPRAAIVSSRHTLSLSWSRKLRVAGRRPL